MSQYDVDKFDPPPDAELVCCICTFVLDEPMETPCRHVFCRHCIETWLGHRRTCPSCRKKVSRRDLKSVLPLVQNMLNKLTMICEFRENGCQKKPALEHYRAHIAKCDFELLTCKYVRCKEQVLRQDLEMHETNLCEFREVLCQQQCGLHVPIKDINSHDCMLALKKHAEERQKHAEELEARLQQLMSLQESLRKDVESLRKQVDQERRRRPSHPDDWFSSSWDSWDDDDQNTHGSSESDSEDVPVESLFFNSTDNDASPGHASRDALSDSDSDVEMLRNTRSWRRVRRLSTTSINSDTPEIIEAGVNSSETVEVPISIEEDTGANEVVDLFSGAEAAAVHEGNTESRMSTGLVAGATNQIFTAGDLVTNIIAEYQSLGSAIQQSFRQSTDNLSRRNVVEGSNDLDSPLVTDIHGNLTSQAGVGQALDTVSSMVHTPVLPAVCADVPDTSASCDLLTGYSAINTLAATENWPATDRNHEATAHMSHFPHFQVANSLDSGQAVTTTDCYEESRLKSVILPLVSDIPSTDAVFSVSCPPNLAEQAEDSKKFSDSVKAAFMHDWESACRYPNSDTSEELKSALENSRESAPSIKQEEYVGSPSVDVSRTHKGSVVDLTMIRGTETVGEVAPSDDSCIWISSTEDVEYAEDTLDSDAFSSRKTGTGTFTDTLTSDPDVMRTSKAESSDVSNTKHGDTIPTMFFQCHQELDSSQSRLCCDEVLDKCKRNHNQSEFSEPCVKSRKKSELEKVETHDQSYSPTVNVKINLSLLDLRKFSKPGEKNNSPGVPLRHAKRESATEFNTKHGRSRPLSNTSSQEMKSTGFLTTQGSVSLLRPLLNGPSKTDSVIPDQPSGTELDVSRSVQPALSSMSGARKRRHVSETPGRPEDDVEIPPSTTQLLAQYSEDSDTSWEPGNSDVEYSDDMSLTDDETASDSSYEVRVPKPLSQLIDELAEEDEDTDDSWAPT
ncbi:uncharacterized protein [Haliotis cracherodii]|uniref:uncharacterized protein n=1 Tax=Haliotis cracherodii TaxID=6455 RepID=UPI0039EA4AED